MARRLARREPVDAQRHRARGTLRQVPGFEPNQQSRHPHERFPRDGELRPFLRPLEVDADTPGRVSPRLAGLRLVADPGARFEIVEVPGRQRDIGGGIYFARAVWAPPPALERPPPPPPGAA